MLTFPILGGRLFFFGGGGRGEGLLDVAAGVGTGQKKRAAEESRPKGLSQIYCGIDCVMWHAD